MTKKKLGGLMRQMKLDLPLEKIDAEMDQRMKKISQKVRIDGFRPGKVPLNIVRENYGDAVRAEVREKLAKEIFVEYAQKNKLELAATPQFLLSPEPAHDISCKVVFEIYPTIKPIPFSKLQAAKPCATVTATDIERGSERIRRYYALVSKVARAATMGDQVVIDYTMKSQADGKLLETQSGVQITLSEKSQQDDVAQHLFGMKGDESKQFHFTREGDDVDCDLTVQSVGEYQLPALNKDFFAHFGEEVIDVDTFHDLLRRQMENEMERAVQQKLKERLFANWLHLYDNLLVPQSLLHNEIVALHRQAHGGGESEETNKEMDEATVKKYTPLAEKKVRLGILIANVVATKNITADAAKVKAAIQRIATQYNQPDQVVNMYYKDKRLLQKIELSVIESTIVEMMISEATITDQHLSYDELIATEDDIFSPSPSSDKKNNSLWRFFRRKNG